MTQGSLHCRGGSVWIGLLMTERIHDITLRTIGSERHRLAVVHHVFDDPDRVIDQASKADYAPGGQGFPGVVAPVDAETTTAMGAACHKAVQVIAPGADIRCGDGPAFSIVTREAFDAVPCPVRPACVADEASAMTAILYLSPDVHGGTVFFRHMGTGFEAIPHNRVGYYKRALEWERRQRRAKFEPCETEHDLGYRGIREIPAEFNSMVVFPSYILHRDQIDRDGPLPLDARDGRLTLNAQFHYVTGAQGAISKASPDTA